MLPWDTKVARATFTAIMVGVAVYGVYLVRRTLLVFLLGIVLAYMIYPLVRRLERLRFQRAPRWVPAATAFVIVLLAVAAIAASLGPPIAAQATAFTDQVPSLLQRANTVETWPVPEFLKPYAGRLADFVRAQVQGGVTAALPLAREVGTGLLHVAGDVLLVVLVPILALLFLLSAPAIRTALARLTARQPRWAGIVDDLNRLFARYIRSLLLLAVAALVAYAAALSLMGAPYALLLAGVAAVLEFIPVFGPLAAALVILVVAGLSGYGHLLWIVLFIAAYRVFQDYLLTPRLMGSGVGVHPILVLFGLLAGEELGGVAGIFFSVPAIAAALIVGRHLVAAAHESDGSRPPV